MLYRIFTEDIKENREAIEKAVCKQFEGYTIIKSEGFWRLQKEKSLIIEIVTEDSDARISKIAKDIKAVNSQEAVLVQKIKDNQWLV